MRLTLAGMTEQRAAPGWYPHPSMAGTQRYWDGAGWTDHVAPAAPHGAAVKPAVSGPLIGVGYVAALMLPLVGFVIGAVVLGKGEQVHGVAMMVLAAVVTVIALNAYM